MTKCNMDKKYGITCLAVIVCLFCGTAIAETGAWNFTVPATEVRLADGVVEFSVGEFADGTAKHYVVNPSPDLKIRFFIVKSVDGVVRAAFDSCDACFRGKKGYKQSGTHMICLNCKLKFRTDKINEVKGGCNPVPLSRTITGDKLVITEKDLLSGTKYFK